MDTTNSDSTVQHTSQGEDPNLRARWALVVAHHRRADMIGKSVRVPPSESIELGRKYDGMGPKGLDDHRISRRHARVAVRKDGAIEIADLGSQNGTYVNGARLDREAILARGDVIRLGSILLLVDYADALPRPFELESFAGMSAALAELVDRLPALAESKNTLALVGESGTGKGHLAEAIHRLSGRSGELVRVSCAAIPDRLVAHELFGYERGAFPGAEAAREGLIARADGGTIVLEEIGDAGNAFQGALVRYLEDGTVRRLGSDTPSPVDARVIVTCSAPLEQAGVRPDLSSRISADVLQLPPLRDRSEDVALLAARFLNELAGDEAALHWRTAMTLMRHSWPGNVRQLRQIVERMVQHSDDTSSLKLSEDVEKLLAAPSWSPAPATSEPAPAPADGIAMPARRLSRQRLQELLREHEGNVTAVASQLGVGRNTVYRWIKVAKIDLDEFRRT